MNRGRKFASSCMFVGLLLILNSAQAQTVSVIAGQGSSDASGIPASSARMGYGPVSVLAPDGTLYFTEPYGRVRKITPSGVIWTIAGLDSRGCYFSGDNGPAVSAGLCNPQGIARDASGNLYIGDSGNNRIRKISTSGIITTIAGTGPGLFYPGGFSGDGGLAVNAQMNWPTWMTFDASGNLYFSDEINDRVRKITPAGIISTVVGSAAGFGGDGGPAASALLDKPTGLAVDSSGNLYIAELQNHRIRKVTPGGIISTIAGSGPTGSRMVGGFSGDGGPALSARMSNPQGLTIDIAGNLFVADSGNRRVRKIDVSGTITTVVGNGTNSPPVDGAPATGTGISPWSVSADQKGDLYITHSGGRPGDGRLVKVDMPTICLPGNDAAECKVNVVEESIVVALDAAAISSAVANLLLDSLTPIQTKLAWIAANQSSPDLARITSQTCSLVNQFNSQMDHYARLRRLPTNLRDAWTADMLEVKVQLVCG